jgi:hypothetical protein
MTIRGFKDIVRSLDVEGREWTQSFRKAASNQSVASYVADYSFSPGTPKPNYYIGEELTATPLTSDLNEDGKCNALWTGGNVAPAHKFLSKVMLMSNSTSMPGTYWLCDYLLFYPVIDMDSTDVQEFVNEVPLPRYADGDGVRMFLVATSPTTGGFAFTVNYLAADGNTYDTPPIVPSIASPFIGTVLSSCNGGVNTGQGAFLPLPYGAKGVVRANSITFLGPNGGLAALVLCKPLATLSLNEITAASEFEFVAGPTIFPRILDGAYLNMLVQTTATIGNSQPFAGTISTFWR